MVLTQFPGEALVKVLYSGVCHVGFLYDRSRATFPPLPLSLLTAPSPTSVSSRTTFPSGFPAHALPATKALASLSQ